MALSFLFFLICGAIIAFIDYKKHIIPDILSIPSVIILLCIKFYEQGGIGSELAAVLAVVIIFLILLYFFADFGGGDLRYGALCAVFLGFNDIFIFFIIVGILHALLLLLLRAKIMGFAPSMFIAAVATKIYATSIWSLL